MALSNRCAAPIRNNGTTVAPGSLDGTQVGDLAGTSVRASFNNENMVPRQQIVDLLDQASTLLPGNVYPQITPEGGRTGRSSGTENHPSGWAADVQLVRQGTVLTPYQEPSLYVAFMAGLVGNSLLNNKVCGLGLYEWGIHIDQTESRQTGRGSVASWNGWPKGVKAGPQEVLDAAISQGRARAASNQLAGDSQIVSDGTSGDLASAEAFPDSYYPDAALRQVEAAKQLQSVCDSSPPASRQGGGCGSMGSFAIASAVSMADGLGVAIPSPVASVTGALSNTLPVSLNAQITNLASKASSFLNVPGLTDISSFATDMLNVGANNPLNALTGKMPLDVAGVINNGLNNIITGPINEIAGNILGNGDLSKFSNIFNTVKGAAGAIDGLATGLTQMQGQLFGNAREIIGGLGINPFEELAGIDIDNIAGGLFQDLIGEPAEILEKVVGDTPLAMFGTAYKDLNSMVTQGFGSLTSDLPALGKDLSNLGKLANMEDLLRIGTPGQIVENLSLVGTKAASQVIIPKLVQKGLSISEINKPENDDTAKEILAEISDPDLIADSFKKLNIRRTPDVENLTALNDPDWLFPTSKQSNRFNHLNETSLHLSAICKENRFSTTEDLGNLLVSMESISAESELLNQFQPLSVAENSQLKSYASPTSDYSGDDTLTVADFIGTAAGYGIVDRLPQMTEYLNELTEEGVLDCYHELLEILYKTLNGEYDWAGGGGEGDPGPGTYLTEWSGVPSLSPLSVCDNRYTFGFYSTMPAAAYAVKDAIESELDRIYAESTGDTLEKLTRLQSLHDEVNHQLFKEQLLRKKYGIDIGLPPEITELKVGNGSTTVFKITGNPDDVNDPNIRVYVDGRKLTSLQFTYNAETKEVTLDAAPEEDATVEIIFSTGNLEVRGSFRDIWSFSGNLENFGTATGFGKEADFLQRVVTDDVHGTRIKSAMMQARNRERAGTYGVECPGYNQILSDFNNENPNGVSTFADVTGIWSSDPGRASEIYLQNKTNLDSREEYAAYLIKKNKNRQQQNFDDIMTTVSRKLIFYSGGYIAISNQLAKFYNNFKDEFRSNSFNSNDILKISLTEDFPSDGFVIGPYKQIISEILRQESVTDLIFDVEMTDQAKAYLKGIDIDLKILVPMIQKVLLVNAANYLGLSESDSKNIFGTPGVGKYLVSSIANQL